MPRIPSSRSGQRGQRRSHSGTQPMPNIPMPPLPVNPTLQRINQEVIDALRAEGVLSGENETDESQHLELAQDTATSDSVRSIIFDHFQSASLGRVSIAESMINTSSSNYIFSNDTISFRTHLARRIEGVGDSGDDGVARIGLSRAASWDIRFQELTKYKSEHACWPIIDSGTPENKKLSRWARFQRKQYKKGKLSNDRISQLNSIGFVWKPRGDGVALDTNNQWHSRFRELVTYKEAHPDKWPYIISKYKSITDWSEQQRKKYKSNKLTEEKITMLNGIGFVWDFWDYKFRELVTHKEAHPDKWPYLTSGSKYKSIANWSEQQRKKYKSNKLTEEQITILNGIGFVWDFWDYKFQLLVEYKNTHQHKWPSIYEKDNNCRLACWATRQRTAYREGKLSKDKVSRLNSIGFAWTWKTPISRIGLIRHKSTKRTDEVVSSDDHSESSSSESTSHVGNSLAKSDSITARIRTTPARACKHKKLSGNAA